MRYLCCFLFCISSYVVADSIDTEALFSDNYEGYLVNIDDWDWSGSKTTVTYSSPDLAASVGEMKLIVACLEGSGADCTPGVLFKKTSEDVLGNKFYLVSNNNQQDVWINANDIKPRIFGEELLTRGGELVFPESFEATDTSQEDGIPDLSEERDRHLAAIALELKPVIGSVELRIPGEIKSLKVKDSYLASDGEFIEYPLSVDSFYFSGETNQFNINSKVYKREGNFLVVDLDSIPELTVNISSMMEQTSFVWLDTNQLDINFDQWNLEQVKDYLNGHGGSYAVNKIQVFNGRQYALVIEQVTIPSPFEVPDEQGVKQKTFSLPYKWIKIRDDKQRLRFWFDLTVSC